MAALAAREGKVDLAAARGSLAKAGRASLDKAEAAKALAARVLAGKANSGAKGKASVARVPSGKLNWASAKGLSARASRVLAAKECSNLGGQQVPFGGNGLQLPFGQANNPLLGNFQPNQTTPPFQSLGNAYGSSPLNGAPVSAQPQTFDALRYVVSPWEQLGANVYVPYPDRYQLGPGDMLTVTILSPYMDAKTST